jgi:hypothetical protein
MQCNDDLHYSLTLSLREAEISQTVDVTFSMLLSHFTMQWPFPHSITIVTNGISLVCCTTSLVSLVTRNINAPGEYCLISIFPNNLHYCVTFKLYCTIFDYSLLRNYVYHNSDRRPTALKTRLLCRTQINPFIIA